MNRKLTLHAVPCKANKFRSQMFRRLSISCAILFWLGASRPLAIYPQNGQAATDRIRAPRICGFRLIEGFGATLIRNNYQAKRVLADIIEAAGLRADTIEIQAAEVDNAYACEDEDDRGGFKRYILYNPSWLNALIQEVGSDWTARAIFAHAVGHHKRGHLTRRTRQS